MKVRIGHVVELWSLIGLCSGAGACTNAGDARGLLQSGECLRQPGQIRRSHADYTKAIEINPQLAAAYLNRGDVYCKLSQKSLANADKKKAVALGRTGVTDCP